MPRAPRVLFIGVDAGDKNLILDWAEAGVLPTFRSLLARGSWADVDNPVGFYEGAVWPSFSTGLSPMGHGRYCHTQLRTGTYDHYRFTAGDIRGEPFWSRLSNEGYRVAIIDVPKTTPSRGNGAHVVDYGTHDPEGSLSTWPQPLAKEIVTEVGRYPLIQCDAYMMRGGPDALPELRDDLLRGVERKAELVQDLLGRQDWDLVIAVFAESHCIGHQAWHVHDPGHPRHDLALARALGDPIRDVYAAIDAAIGRLLAAVGDETAVFVLASHGMGPNYPATSMLDEMLRRLEQPRPSASRRVLARLAERTWTWLPASARRIARPVRTTVKHSLRDAVTVSEAAHRRCFQIPNNDAIGGIRINVVGREPQGRVRPGAEYQALCDELTHDLIAFVDANTGRPVVARVLRTAEIYAGERVDDFPDLLVEWRPEACGVTVVQSPKAGTIRSSVGHSRTGAHRPHGLLIVVDSSSKRPLSRLPMTAVGNAVSARVRRPC